MWEPWVRFLGWGDLLEKGKATYSSILAWRIPWTIVYGVTKSRTCLSDFQKKGSILQRSAFFTIQLSYPYMTTRKTIALFIQTFASTVMALLFNICLGVSESIEIACMHAKSLRLYPILCDFMDCSPPGSSIHTLLQEISPTQDWTCFSYISCFGKLV